MYKVRNRRGKVIAVFSNLDDARRRILDTTYYIQFEVSYGKEKK